MEVVPRLECPNALMMFGGTTPLAGGLARVRMSQLVWSEPTPRLTDTGP
jgi:hypothetical protein